MQPAAPRASLSSGVKALLAGALLINIYIAFRHFAVYRDLVDHEDDSEAHWPRLVLAIVGGVGALAVVGLWLRQRWTLFVVMAITLIGALVILFKGVWSGVGPLLLAAVATTFWQKRRELLPD